MGLESLMQGKGLLGMGMAQPPAGLLGPYYDPKQERQQKLLLGLQGAGLALLQNGKGSFGEVLGQGAAGFAQGANNAGINYRQDAMGYNQLDMQMKEQKEKERQKAAIMQWLDGLPDDQQELARVNPQMAAEAYMKQQFAGTGESKVLSPGQTIVGPDYKPLYTAPDKQPEPTTGIKDYEYYVQSERAAGRQPLGPLEYEKEVRKSGATSINNITGANGDFDKELSKGVAGVYTSAMEAGQNAMATKSAAQQLRVLMKNRGGALDGLAAAAAPYLPPGLVPEGANDVVAAQAIVAGLIPKQRVPGAGTTSDFDAKKFSESLVNIWNKPGANEIITNTMESYADYQISVSNAIAEVASDPTVANKAAAIRERISQIPDPFIGWKQYMAASGSAPQTGTGKTDIDSRLQRYK